MNFIDLIGKYNDFSGSKRSIDELSAMGGFELEEIIDFDRVEVAGR